MKLFQRTALLSLIVKIKFLFRWGSQLLGMDGWKMRDKTGKTVLFPGIAGKIVPIFALEE